MWHPRSNFSYKGLIMNDLELIHELDARLELVRTAWADELIELCNNSKIEKDSRKYQNTIKKLSKKYSPLMAKILIERQNAFDRELARQQNAEQQETKQGESKLDEFGRPKDKYWKDGKWQYYKKAEGKDNSMK